jgi:predicted nucleotidyltransferase
MIIGYICRMERRKQILTWIKEVLDRNLSGIGYDAFVFGSQANRSELSRSDIDIGILSEKKIQTWQFSNIIADIEQLPILYKIDVVDFKEADEQFRSIALQNIEKL